MSPFKWLLPWTAAVALGVAALAAEPSAPPSWGRITAVTNSPGQLRLEVAQWPADGRLLLPAPGPSILAATWIHDTRRTPVAWNFNPDATRWELSLPTNPPAVLPAVIEVETGDASGQLSDGRIVFAAADAQVHGTTAHRETALGNQRIGSWTDAADYVTWDFKPTRWGRYSVDVVYSADGGAGTEVTVEIAGEKLTASRPSTGSGNTYQTLSLGSFYLAKSDPFVVRVGCPKLVGAAVMNLQSVVLRPAPEGEVAAADAAGVITLRAAQATTHSVRMRYEPQAIKNCLGYWVETSDWADWTFPVGRAGVYDIEVWQGCGKGQGGSDVAVEIAGRRFDFVVEETGHFQSFLPRKVGRVELAIPGTHHLAIRPQRKAAGAIMDIRQIRLVPVPEGAQISPLLGPQRVVFLGDSITYGGEWVEFAETLLRWRHPNASVDWINLGLPSETVSGLSEPGHAGGAFPRPGVLERLGRVLEKTQPTVVVACYGMNDGIYYPYGEDRAAAFRNGQEQLHTQAAAIGARVIHLTPPTFDPIPLKGRTLPAGLTEYKSPYEGYNEVLDRYSAWLLSQRERGWQVIDFHGPMNDYLAQRRRTEPAFVLAGDGVHASTLGHWRMAREFVQALEGPGLPPLPETPAGLNSLNPRLSDVLKEVQARQRVQKDAWLTAVGHIRPGMSRGQPVATAQQAAIRHAAAAHDLAAGEFPGKRTRWYGFDRFDFTVNGKAVTVVAPSQPAPGRPWAWHGEFFGHKPNPDIALLARGFHIVYMSVPDLLGAPAAVQAWDALYENLTTRHDLNPKPALVGLSRGGLYCYNWAVAHPDRVGCLYGDAPVCDFKSWPGGFGKGQRSDRDWQLTLQHYGFKNDEEAKAYTHNPVDSLAGLAAAKVPLLHVYGDADEVVPWTENTGLIAERYRALGGSITLIGKPGVKHHPHGLDDSTPIVDFIWQHAAPPEARAALAKHGGGPTDATGRPLIRKRGTVDLDLVETTPIVFNGALWRFEWVRQGEGQQYWDNQRKTNYFRFRNPATGEVTAPFADGHEFGSAFVDGGVVYVTGTLGRGQINVFASKDLKTWETWTAVPAGRYGIFNTSVCRAGDEFVMMFEIDRPQAEAGVAFTARFAKSRDFKTWTLTPPECNYARDRYTAPHALRFRNGWYYDFYLEAHEGYELRLVRSRDLQHWENSPHNPVLRASQEDQLFAEPKLTDAQRNRIVTAANRNNSDIDFCEYNGRLIIQYSWGNQLGIEHLAEATYEGSEAQFLDGWFAP